MSYFTVANTLFARTQSYGPNQLQWKLRNVAFLCTQEKGDEMRIWQRPEVFLLCLLFQ